MQPVEYDVGGQPVERRCGPLDLGHPGQERQQRARIFGQPDPAGRRHRDLDPNRGIAPQMTKLERPGPTFALDPRRVREQSAKTLPVERRRHRDDPQILAQGNRRVERESKRKIIVEAPLMHLVEQQRRYAAKFRVRLNPRQEHPMGHRDHPGSGRNLAVEPGLIPDNSTRLLTRLPGNEFRRRPRRQPPRHEQQDLPPAPRLAEQRRCNRSRLSGPRRRNQQRPSAVAQCVEQFRQNGMDGEVDHARPVRGAARRRNRLVSPRHREFDRLGERGLGLSTREHRQRIHRASGI